MSQLSRPVNISQIQSCLGVSSSVNKASQLCTHANVNKWAKYKPIKYAAGGIMDQYDYTLEKWKDDSDWWKGAGGNMGFTPYTTTSFANIISNTTGGMNGWTYDGVPTGGSYPYRLADFIGYNHDAVPVVQNFDGSDRVKNLGVFVASCDIAQSVDNVSLEIMSQALYFGVAICKSNGDIVFHGTCDQPFEGYLAFTLRGVSQGTYDVIPFLCTQAIEPDTGDFPQIYTFWTVPCVSKYSLSVVATSASLTCTFTWPTGAHTSMTVTIVNNDPSSYTGTIYVRHTDHTWVDGDTATEPSMSFTVSGNGTVNKFFRNLSADYNYHVTIVLQNGDRFEAQEGAHPIDPTL